MGYLKTEGDSGDSSEPPEPPLDPPLRSDGCWVVLVFSSYSNFNWLFCKQTVETLIRRKILWHLVWSALFLTRKAYMYTFIQNSPWSRAQINLFSLVTSFTATVYFIPISTFIAFQYNILQPQFISYKYPHWGRWCYNHGSFSTNISNKGEDFSIN